MYNRFFGLDEDPFSIAANPRFVYLGDCHREALAHLVYGIRSDSGFVLLTGEVGTGKTTMCRCLLERLPQDTDVAYILNPRVTVAELLESICDELHIDVAGGASIKAYVDAINADLLRRHAAGRGTVVIVDEAQNLSFDVLEQLRLLTNLETNERKLLRIILIGQPELETMLRQPEFKQLEQRITARYQLQPLAKTEIGRYVSHRLAVAGCDEPVFSPAVLARLYRHTRGIPRRINIICDRALLGAYVRSKRRVDRPTLIKAAREVDGASRAERSRGPLLALATLILCAVALTLAQFAGEPGWALPRPDAAALTGAGAPADAALPAPAPDPVPADAIALAEPGTEPAPAADNPDVSNRGWPSNLAVSENSLAAAFATQFGRWRVAPPAVDADPCTSARAYRLYCYSGIANLGSLQDYDRPAILTLRNEEDGERYYATLLGLDGKQATLAFAHGTETVALAELEARWRGRFQLLWRGSPNGATLIKPGSSGANVAWLTRTLADVGIAIEPSARFDAAVVAAVKSFQREHDLVADGIVGRQTLMRLNSIGDPSIPRLDEPRAG